MRFDQLLPTAAQVEIADLLDSLKLAELAPQQRPYVIANFVASADGRATVAGRSGALGDDGDHAVFHGLRERVDAVIAGTGTLRTERYGRILGKAERRERRVARGSSAEPLACVITRSGEVPTDIPLFTEPESRIIVFSPVEVEGLSDCPAQTELVLLDPGEMTVTTALRHLRTGHGVASLLCEGGPTLFGSLLQEDVVDELFLTVAPLLTGGGMGPTISSGPELVDPHKLQLRWVLERNGALYHRYGLR